MAAPSAVTSSTPTDSSDRRAVAGWAAAVLVYFTATFHRSSLGVAALLAEDRFGISASQLSVFVLLQLGIYAAMQVPAGILVDRFGPRRLLAAAAATMGVAQLLFAVAPSYPMALLARAVLGCGDALTFVSVLRFAAVTFSPRRYPLVVLLTGMVGQAGNVLATVPLALLLHSFGWGPTFATTSCVSLAAGLFVWWRLPKAASKPALPRTVAGLRAPAARVAGSVRAAWRLPATRAGFWLHFACTSSVTTFGVLWGVPYLVRAQGFTITQASAVLLENVAVAVVVSPFIGTFIGRHPGARVPLAIGVSSATVASWIVLSAGFGGHPPTWMIVLHVAIMALCGPVSMVAFALARDYNAPGIVGTATGVVNVGGFLATIIAAVSIGWVLDALGGSGAGQFRVAILVLVVVQGLGTVQATRWWLRTRAVVLAAQRRGEPVPVPVVRHRFDLG